MRSQVSFHEPATETQRLRLSTASPLLCPRLRDLREDIGNRELLLRDDVEQRQELSLALRGACPRRLT